MWKYHIFFCSPTEGHHVHLQVLAIIGKAAVDICIQVLCGHKFSTRSGKCLGVQLLDCMVKTMVSFVRNCQTVFRLAVFVTFSPAINESSCCFTYVLVFGVVHVLGFSLSNRYLVASDCFIYLLIHLLGCTQS